VKRSKVYTYVVSLLLVVLVVSGCAAPKTPPAPATAQPSPTVQDASPTPSKPLLTISYSAGDQCNIDGPSSIQSGLFQVDVVVDSWEHDMYGLGVGNIPADKTPDELQDSLNQHLIPDWLTVISFEEFTKASGSRISYTYYSSPAFGPLIFSCFWSDPIAGSTSERNERNFETLGPIPVVKEP